MKKILKRTLSVIMVVLMLLTSAPLGGFVGINLQTVSKAANRYTINNSANISGEDIVAKAREWLGCNATYWSGTSPWQASIYWRCGFSYEGRFSFDCSGFVGRVLNDCGFRSTNYTPSYGSCVLSEKYGSGYIGISIEELVNYGDDITSSVLKAKNGDFSELRPGDIIGWNWDWNTRHVIIYAGYKNGVPWMVEFNGVVDDRAITDEYKSLFRYGARITTVSSSSTSNHIKESFPSHCTIKVTEKDKKIMSLPCSKKTDSKSDEVEDAPKGRTYEAIGLVLNSQDNLWYKVKAKNGKEGYIFAGNVSFEGTINSDIADSDSGITVPANHTQGKTYTLTGSIKNPYKIISEVSVYIYPGNNTSGTSKTGGSAAVNETSYSFGGSSIDKKTKFNILPVGTYTYVVKATYKSYYAKSDKEYGIRKPSEDIILYKKTFNVVSGNTSTEVQQPTTILYPTNGGIYKIAAGVGNNMYLDFACSSENVQIYENCDGHSNPDFVKSQYFKLTHVGDGWYTITNPANGKAMDVYDWRTASGTNIQQWDLHSGDNQLFRFYDAGNGYCYIKSKLGTYVDVQNADNVNNTNVWAYSFNGSNAQKWKLQSHSHSYSSKVITQPTHLKEGVRTYTCKGCLATYTESVAKTSTHTYSTAVTAPTCTAEGYTKYTCACGSSYKSNYVSKFDHTYSNSCDTSCNRCGATRTISHTYTNNCDTTCNVCGATRSITHNYAAASCTVAAKCTVCGATDGNALGHTYTNDCDESCNVCDETRDVTHSYTEATCTTPATCEICGATEGNALGHTYTNDCDETCNVCDETRTITHNYVLEAATNTYICSVCGDSYTEKVEAVFKNNEKAKLNDNLLLMVPGVTLNELLSSASDGAYVKDVNGEKIADTVLPGTGMTLVLPENKECTIIAYGDVDGDGAVKAADARSALRAAVGLDVLPESSKTAADLAETSAEKKITSADARFILRAAVGLESIKDWFNAFN